MERSDSSSWWVRPAACHDCHELIGLDESVVVLGRDIVERVAGRVIRVPDPNAIQIHARHWDGGRKGWYLVREWPTLREAAEYYGP